jgi:hypothetical protein
MEDNNYCGLAHSELGFIKFQSLWNSMLSVNSVISIPVFLLLTFVLESEFTRPTASCGRANQKSRFNVVKLGNFLCDATLRLRSGIAF